MLIRMCITNIESTVIKICREISISKGNHSWFEMKEADLLFELVNAILGSQVPNELATTAANRLRDKGLLNVPTKSTFTKLAKKIEKVLSLPLFNDRWGTTGRRYRFPKLRANYISRTIHNIYSTNGSLKNILVSCSSANKARLNLVRSVLGIGPKQASLFLRNIGYTNNLAVLDSHVLRYMNICGMTRLRSSPSNLKTYEKTENRLLEYSKVLGFPLGYLDQAIWITMRVARKEALI